MNVNSFQCLAILTRLSNRMRCNNFSALYGMSLVVAMFSATLNWADRCTLYESCNEYLVSKQIISLKLIIINKNFLWTWIEKIYPNNFGLNSFRIFGKVRCVRNVPWPDEINTELFYISFNWNSLAIVYHSHRLSNLQCTRIGRDFQRALPTMRPSWLLLH